MSGSLIELGMAATALALVLALCCVAFAIVGNLTGRPAFVHVARQSLLANLVLVTLAVATVVWSFVQNDFSVAYVAQNSNTRLPLIYRLTALWGAHEGSLLLWLWFLTLYSALAVLLHWESHPRSMPHVMTTLAGVQGIQLSATHFEFFEDLRHEQFALGGAVASNEPGRLNPRPQSSRVAGAHAGLFCSGSATASAPFLAGAIKLQMAPPGSLLGPAGPKFGHRAMSPTKGHAIPRGRGNARATAWAPAFGGR